MNIHTDWNDGVTMRRVTCRLKSSSTEWAFRTFVGGADAHAGATANGGDDLPIQLRDLLRVETLLAAIAETQTAVVRPS